MKKASVVFVLLGLLVMGLGCCCPETIAIATPGPVKISGEEMLNILRMTFSHLETGKTLFITTGEYWVFDFVSYEQVFRTLPQLPPCRYKAALVVLGELHRALNPLVAAGIAMGQSGLSPAWFVVLVDNTRTLYGLDPTTGKWWPLRNNDVALIII